MSTNPGRREREKQQRREDILLAAEKLFAQKEYHRCTMEEVADRAEFSVGTLYNFFKGKDELYRSLIEMRCGQISDILHKRLDQEQDPESQIKTFITTKVELLGGEFHEFTQLYSRERLGDRFTDNELWSQAIAPLYQEIIKRLTDILRNGIEQGVFRDDISPEDMIIAIEGLTDNFKYDSLMHRCNARFTDKLDIMIKLCLNGVQKR